MTADFNVQAPDVDPRAFRDAFGRFATGVALAACRNAKGETLAVTINSLTSVSLDPPLALFCLEKTARTAEAFLAADRFAFSILSAEQREASQRYARAPEAQEGDFEIWEGAPVLPGALAKMVCAPYDVVGGGDHLILLGRVLHVAHQAGDPLLYFGGYAGLTKG